MTKLDSLELSSVTGGTTTQQQLVDGGTNGPFLSVECTENLLNATPANRLYDCTETVFTGAKRDFKLYQIDKQ